MRPNTSGTYNVNDSQVGRGIIQYAPLNTGGLPGGFLDLGNCTDFTFNVEAETLDHQSFREAIKELDKTDILSKKIGYTFTLDSVNQSTLALFLSGDATLEATNLAVAGFTEHEMVPEGDIAKLRTYMLVDATGEQALNVLEADVTVKTTNVTPITLVLDTDYTVDEVGGSFTLLDTAAVGTAITNVEGLDVTLVAQAGAGTLTKITALTSFSAKGSIRFAQVDPTTDKKTYFIIPQTSIIGSGDFAAIGDEWQNIAFEGSAERNSNMPTGKEIMYIEYPDSQA
ncbi:MAG: hypothetical protein GY845_25580 [Planctomycetes bacterium]|nr:hypothetical protein [Planctomycetota bacterium]